MRAPLASWGGRSCLSLGVISLPPLRQRGMQLRLDTCRVRDGLGQDWMLQLGTNVPRSGALCNRPSHVTILCRHREVTLAALIEMRERITPCAHTYEMDV